MNEVNDSDLKNLPEMATLTVKPFVLSPKTCPKCGRGPLRFKAGRDGIGGTLEKPGPMGRVGSGL
jgi:hypothetical protein